MYGRLVAIMYQGQTRIPNMSRLIPNSVPCLTLHFLSLRLPSTYAPLKILHHLMQLHYPPSIHMQILWHVVMFSYRGVHHTQRPKSSSSSAIFPANVTLMHRDLIDRRPGKLHYLFLNSFTSSINFHIATSLQIIFSSGQQNMANNSVYFLFPFAIAAVSFNPSTQSTNAATNGSPIYKFRWFFPLHIHHIPVFVNTLLGCTPLPG